MSLLKALGLDLAHSSVTPLRDKAVTSTPYKPKALDQVITMVKEAEADVADLASIDAAIAERQSYHDQLFAIEEKAKAEVDKQITDLKARRHVVAGASAYSGKYLPISHEVLKWRDKLGLPKLVLFSLASPTFSITLERGRSAHQQWVSRGVASPGSLNQLNMNSLQNLDWQQMAQAQAGYYAEKDCVSPEYPAPLRALLNDVVNDLRGKSGRQGKYIRVAATFNGVIPASTRAKIAEAKKVFKAIFIMAEPDLSYEEVQLPIGDPVVCGWDGQQLWFVDDFETTAVEEAALLVGPANK